MKPVKILRTFPLLALCLFLVYCGVESIDAETPENPGGTTGTTTPGDDPSEDLTGPDVVSFVALGDWGSGDQNQRTVRSAIRAYCSIHSCQFVQTLGDNFYPDGVSGTDDPQWQTTYKDIYAELNLPFYAALGNHDIRGNEQAQIDYSAIDSTWHMPAEYYSSAWPDGSSLPTVEIFVWNAQNFDTTVQNWMRDAISNSRATWKIVVMHFPIYRNRKNGDDNGQNNTKLLPIICEKIDLVVTGHEHQFTRMRDESAPCPSIDQLTMGTGGAELDEKRNDPRLVANGYFYGFGWFQADPEKIHFRMIKSDGTLFYSASWKKH